MSTNAPLPKTSTIFETDYQAQEIIDGELWIQLRDGRWGTFGPGKPRTGSCTYCRHTKNDSCFRPNETLESHESRCSGLSLCPATRPMWCGRHHYFEPDQHWGVTKKALCVKCYAKKYVSFGLTVKPLDEPRQCEDCGGQATEIVLLATDPYTSLVDCEIFSPFDEGLFRVSGFLGLPGTKVQFFHALRVEADRRVRLSRIKE